MGYYPLVAFDGITGDFLKAALRSGNVYTSNVGVLSARSLTTTTRRSRKQPRFFAETLALRCRHSMIYVEMNRCFTSAVKKHGRESGTEKIEAQDEAARNAIEGKFGEGKRGRVSVCLQSSSETVIALNVLLMNLSPLVGQCH